MKTLIGAILALILVSMPFTSSVMTIEEEAENEHPEYYEVTRYNMRGLTYDKETIRVSYSDAMAIKDAFEGIDSSLTGDKIEMKSNVLQSYGLIQNNIKKVESKGEIYDNEKHFDILLASRIKGTFGPSIINIIHWVTFSPIFLTIASGINVKYNCLYILWFLEFTSDKPIMLFMFFFDGIILVFPFISPSGYIDGIAPLGWMTELI